MRECEPLHGQNPLFNEKSAPVPREGFQGALLPLGGTASGAPVLRDWGAAASAGFLACAMGV